MKKTLLLATVLFSIASCTTLTHQEKRQLEQLRAHGITIDRPAGSWSEPASPAIAGALNILPGFGNFYLASGNASESSHWIYGGLNLITWPFSIFWGVPEAAIDAGAINKRDMLYFYNYDKNGKKELQTLNITLE